MDKNYILICSVTLKKYSCHSVFICINIINNFRLVAHYTLDSVIQYTYELEKLCERIKQLIIDP